MPGYAGQTIRLPFDSLSADPDTDPIWVVIRNPMLQPPQALRPDDASVYDKGDDGKLRDYDAAVAAGQKTAARLVVAWRVYDPGTSAEFDSLTGEQVPGTGQVLMPPPSGGNGVPPEQYAKLPQAIQTAVMEQITEAINPPSDSAATTPKTSSGQPSPSTTEPGPAEPAPQNWPTTS